MPIVLPLTALSRLSPLGLPTSQYGDFSGRAPTAPENIRTLGLVSAFSPLGLPTQRYGDFSGRGGQPIVIFPRHLGLVTAFSPLGLPTRLYGDFSGRNIAPTLILNPLYTLHFPEIDWWVDVMQAARNFRPGLGGSTDSEVGGFDYDRRLPPNVIILSAVVTAYETDTGAAADIVIGGASPVTSPTSNLPLRAVAQAFGNTEAKNYIIICQAQCSDGRERDMDAILPSYNPLALQ